VASPVPTPRPACSGPPCSRGVKTERDLIRARTSEGRERAKARGVKLGRKPKLTPHQQREAIRRRESGRETLAEIGRSYNVSGWTIARLTG
jgi:DNA invertase Pin-like site-specific DNA recombinase